MTDQDQGGAFQFVAECCIERAQSRAHHALIGPGGAPDHRHRAISAVMRRQGVQYVLQHMHRQMNRKRRAGPGEILQRLARRHCGGAPGNPRQDQRLRHAGQRQFDTQGRRCCGKRRHAGGHVIADVQRAQTAQLFTHRRPQRHIARVQPRHIQTRRIGCGNLGNDLIQRQRGGVDDPRPARAMRQQGHRHQ